MIQSSTNSKDSVINSDGFTGNLDVNINTVQDLANAVDLLTIVADEHIRDTVNAQFQEGNTLNNLKIVPNIDDSGNTVSFDLEDTSTPSLHSTIYRTDSG